MQKETLSALMDGETLDSEVVTALTQDADLQAEWAGYHLIRDTMRGDLPDVMHFDIASRVAEALAQEPVYIAPQAIPESQPEPKTWRDYGFVAKLRPWASQLTQIGMAACVSLAVIIGVQHYNTDGTESVVNGDASAFNTVPFMGSASPVSLDLKNGTGLAPQTRFDQERGARLNAIFQQYELDRRVHTDGQPEVKQTATPEQGRASSQPQQ
ncbi:TPA: anti-sigma-E factor RseA [Morganella morganii subsp. morganii]|nr:anti-sigma-E factor RseA [Morganella morganii subsp. morganii]